MFGLFKKENNDEGPVSRFGVNNYEAKKEEIQYRKHNTLNADLAKEMGAKLASSAVTEMKHLVETFIAEATPDFVHRIRNRTRYGAKIAAADT